MEHDESESGERAPTILEIAERLRDDLNALRKAALQRRDELVSLSQRYVEKHPLAAVGVAFGAGYVLSGGLFSGGTARLFKLGVRLYVNNLVRGVAAGVMGGVMFDRVRDGTGSRVAH